MKRNRWFPVCVIILSVLLSACQTKKTETSIRTSTAGETEEEENWGDHPKSSESSEKSDAVGKESGHSSKESSAAAGSSQTDPGEETERSDSSEETLTLLTRTDWNPRVRENLNAFLTLYGRGGASYKDTNYVVFDFDNTTVIFDIEMQLLAYQLRTMAYAMTPAEFESLSIFQHTEYAAYKADLSAAYGRLCEAYGPFTGTPLSTGTLETLWEEPEWQEFGAKLLAFSGAIQDGDEELLFPLYLFQGMTEDQVYDLAYEGCSCYASAGAGIFSLTSPSSRTSQLGVVTGSISVGCRVTENIKELWKALSEDGIRVYVCSASGSIPVRAAIDAYGLHDYCSGVGAINLALSEGKMTCALDPGQGWYMTSGQGWVSGGSPYFCITTGVHKCEAIEAGPGTLYGTGPLAGFMDSTGDFNFCTEFASMKLVLCFNRAVHTLTNGGGVIAVLAVCQEDQGLSLQEANAAGDILYLLQGRDENSMTLRASRETVRYSESDSRLFSSPEIMESAISYASSVGLSAGQFLETFGLRKASGEAGNPLPYEVGFLSAYRGYRSR